MTEEAVTMGTEAKVAESPRWQEAAVVVRQLSAVSAPLHVDGHDFYGFVKLPADELGRRYTLHRFSPAPPEGMVTAYDGAGHWRHIHAA